MSVGARQYSTLTLYRRLILQGRPYWPHVCAFLLLSLLATPLALLVPLPLKIGVDTVLQGRPLPRWMESIVPGGAPASEGAVLLLVAVTVLVIAVLTQVHGLVTTMLKTYVSEKLVIDFRSRLFRHVQQLSLAYHDRQGTSDSNYRIQYDATSIQHVVIDSVIPLISAVTMLFGMLYVTARLSPKLALVALVICPPLFALTVYVRGRLRQQWRDVKKLESSAQSIVQEVLGAVRVVKAFTRESHENERFEHHSRTGMAARLRVGFAENFYGMLVGLLLAAGTSAVMWVGLRDVLAGMRSGRSDALTLGGLLMVMAYLGKLYDPIKTLGRQLAAREKAMVSAERVFALLDEAPEVAERPNAMPLERANGAVSFRNVSFHYPAADSPVLRDISLDIPAGTRVGIAGRTGAGKTTLINLLCRFYDPTSGQVSLDGNDLRDYRILDLRNQFSIVLQEPVLFSATIAENIAYGRPGASIEEIVAAAKAANAHDFIEALQDGYETQVGERGMCLSGGERQRISLARAFLKDAPILILDEPTSSVDVNTESQIMDAMERLMRGRTTFMITHRQTTLKICDVVVRIDGGRIVESTTTQPQRLPDVPPTAPAPAFSS
jgi:ATP-binding cassette, subfamily B, bacterial